METTAAFADRRLGHTPVAIVGMAGLFPQARNSRDYWQNIVDGVDCSTEVPPDRWRVQDYYDPDPSVPDRSYAKRGGFLPEIDFSPIEFGIPPNLLGVTSSLQTLSLLVARDVLADAGVEGSSWYDASRTGVVLGVVGCVGLMHPLAMRLATPVLREVVRSCGLTEDDAREIAERYASAFAPWEENSFPGLLANVTAGRIANRFDLGGMNCTVDAACAASLSAVRMAVAELVDGRADMMITGGCDTENSIFTYMCFSATGALAHSDRVRPFDRSADGTLLGEGIGMLALKRLADAERDGDRVYAVIRGIGSSSDGRAKSIYAPRAEGQHLALRRAYADAGVPISSVELFEAHATGTAVGDRTEIGALSDLLREAGDERRYAAIGSVKSQIGHTKGAAGAASLMKTALALHHKVLPPTIGVEDPNDALADGPLYLNTVARPWIRDPRRPLRRAGVSAMGFGGTNFHVVLEERADRVEPPLHRTPSTYLWHAPDIASLVRVLRSDEPAATTTPPTDHPRIALVTSHPDRLAELRDEAADLVDARPAAGEWSTPSGTYYRARGLPDPRVGALFAGQGSQYVDMGRSLVLDRPAARRAFDEAEAAAAAGSGTRLGQVVFPPRDPGADETVRPEDVLRRTEFAQPAIGAVSVAQFRLMRELGLEPTAYLGHSFGELTALWAADALDDADFFALAHARGTAMAPRDEDGDSGAMAALQCSADDARAYLAAVPDVVVCNYNAVDQVVVGGPTDQVDAVVEACGAAGVTARRLPVSAAFHTALVEHAVDGFRPAVERAALRAPRARVLADTAGAAYGDDVAANREVLVRQLINPVDFVGALRSMTDESGCTVLVEFGPKQVLTQLARRTVADDVITVPVDSGPLGDGAVAFQRAVAQLLVAGVALRPQPHPVPEQAAGAGPAAGTIGLTGAEYVPPARREAYLAAISTPLDGVRAADASPVPVPEPAPATAPQWTQPTPEPTPAAIGTAELDVAQPTGGLARQAAAHQPDTVRDNDERVAEVLARQTDLHERYLQAQLRVADELVAGHPLASTLAEHSTAMSAAHTTANDVLARLAAWEFGGADATGPVDGHRNGDGRGNGHPNGHAAGTRNGAVAVSPAPAIDSPATQAVASDLVISGDVPGSGRGATRPDRTAPGDGPAPTRPAGTSGPAARGDVTAAAGPDADTLRATVTAVVADRTGYTVAMIDPTMDLEADLGVDSIKRVQIISLVGERHPELPELGPETLAELRTINQLVAHYTAESTEAAAPAVPTGPDADTLRATVTAVVADRTGYTVAMIDPTMDLEADLGVDSIKRVQIISLVGERHPELPELGPETLAELRTINQLVAHYTAGSPVDAIPPTGVPRLPVVPVALPPVDVAPRPYAPDPVLAVVQLGAGTADADAVADAARAGGWTVARLTLDDAPDGWLGEDWDHGGLEHRLDGFLTALARLDAGVVCVGTPAGTGVGVRLLADAVLVAKHAVRRLTADRSDAHRAAFLALTRIDGRLGTDGTGGAERLLGGLAGLTRTVAAELPTLFARTLDVHPDVAGPALADTVLTELADAAAVPHAVGRDARGGRWTVTPTPEDTVPDGSATPSLTGDDVVLVTGGARGVTAHCVVALAGAVPAEFVLIGRSSVAGDDPAWSLGVADDDLMAAAIGHLSDGGKPPLPRAVAAACDRVRARREVAATLAAVTAAGARVRYLDADVADATAVADALGEDARRVTVVVHGAGALADRPLVETTGDDLRRVFAPKLGGLDAVLRATDPETLRQVVLFCSVAGVYGNGGQSDYAVANEALSRWPVPLRPDGGPRVLGLAWGAWDGGMVGPELRAVFEARGVPLLEPAAAAAAFVDELTGQRPAGTVLLAPPVPLHDQAPATAADHIACRDLADLATGPTMLAHQVGDAVVLPAVHAVGWLAAVAETAHPGRRVVRVDAFEVLRGITFDGGDRRHHVRLRTQDVEGDTVVVAAAIGDGDDPGSAPRYRAELRLAAPTQAPTGSASGAAYDPPVDEPDDGLDLYRDGVLFHGPRLQGIRSILERGPDALRVACRLPRSDEPDLGYRAQSYRPAPTDTVLQAAVVLAAESGTVGWLPLGVDRLDLWAALPEDGWFTVDVRVVERGALRMRCDADVHAADGAPLARLTGIALVTTPGMAEKFRDGVRTWRTDDVVAVTR